MNTYFKNILIWSLFWNVFFILFFIDILINKWLINNVLLIFYLIIYIAYFLFWYSIWKLSNIEIKWTFSKILWYYSIIYLFVWFWIVVYGFLNWYNPIEMLGYFAWFWIISIDFNIYYISLILLWIIYKLFWKKEKYFSYLFVFLLFNPLLAFVFLITAQIAW